MHNVQNTYSVHVKDIVVTYVTHNIYRIQNTQDILSDYLSFTPLDTYRPTHIHAHTSYQTNDFKHTLFFKKSNQPQKKHRYWQKLVNRS